MPFVVTDNCIRCKYTDCVTVCPTQCFYEGEVMLVIAPDECIDCGACAPVCPAEAIREGGPEKSDTWARLNREMSRKWPNIPTPQPPFPMADANNGTPDKYASFFSDLPASRAGVP